MIEPESNSPFPCYVPTIRAKVNTTPHTPLRSLSLNMSETYWICLMSQNFTGT